MIGQDYHRKHSPRIPRQQAGAKGTFIGFIAMLACFTLMGWSCTDKYTPVSQYIDKQDLKVKTAAQLAEYTAKLNQEMERRAKDGAKK